VKLTLKTERLAELTHDELNLVGGAAGIEQAITSPLRDCLRTVFGCTTAMTCP
jgi:hypothetical protein